jgi:hypothetical protein
MGTEDVAALTEKLTRAYLAGDGAAVVRLMELIAAAECNGEARTPRKESRAA